MSLSNKRKRQSRFSDVSTDTTHTPGEFSKDSSNPAALAKAAAAKIAKVIPNSSSISLSRHDHMRKDSVDPNKARTDQIYKSVQEQMNQIRALLQGSNDNGGKSFMPAPLLLDDQGRPVDASGNVINDHAPSVVATLKANKASTKSAQNPYLVHRTIEKEDKLETVDPRLKLRKRETRKTKSFSFVKQGTFIKQAEQFRAREAKRMLAGITSGRNTRDGQSQLDAESGQEAGTLENTPNINVQVPLKPDSNTPDIEWWNIDYLSKDLKPVVDAFGYVKSKCRKENPNLKLDYSELKLKYCGTAHLIEHPSKLNVITRKSDGPVALPLLLTPAERKKIRRQNRAEREKEKQDKIALGLVPPPEPKVKLSNMMRVLAEQAVADPSAIERKVRQQVEERERNHELRNLARKLTPEERREKKLRKIKQDALGDTHVALFRVHDLSDPKHRFKVDVNAQQYHLTGAVIVCKEDDIHVVVVEGGKKAIKRYIRLMTERISWNHERGCALVWHGIVARKAFHNFRFQECRTSATARKVMEAKNVGNYWDLVENSMDTNLS